MQHRGGWGYPVGRSTAQPPWGPRSFRDLQPPPTAVHPGPKSCWQPCDWWEGKNPVASGPHWHTSFDFFSQETSCFYPSKNSTLHPNKFLKPPPPVQGGESVWESSSPEPARPCSAAPYSDLAQLGAIRAPRLAEVTDAERQAPLACALSPHTHHRWPCHLTLAQCPDGPRTLCRPHWGLPRGDGDAMMKWGALVTDRGEWHLEGGAEVLSSPLALHPGRDPIGRKV